MHTRTYSNSDPPITRSVFLVLYYFAVWLFLSKEGWEEWRLHCREAAEREAQERFLSGSRKYADVNLNIGWDLSPDQLERWEQTNG